MGQSSGLDHLDELGELRNLLGTSEGEQINALRAQLNEMQRRIEAHEVAAPQVASVLAEAVEQRGSDGPELHVALTPEVRAAIHRGARHDTDAMAEALFPVLGRAVRMMVSEMLSPGGGAENGKTFTVDQIYVMERDSGLPIASLVSGEQAAADADVVSGMLEGIRSFVQDSFDARDIDGMRELEVGDVTVWVEWGPKAILAAVLRGFPTPDFRFAMQRFLEDFHRDLDAELADWDGDPDTLGDLLPRLSGLQAEAPPVEAPPSRLRTMLPVVLGLLLVVILVALAVIGLLSLFS